MKLKQNNLKPLLVKARRVFPAWLSWIAAISMPLAAWLLPLPAADHRYLILVAALLGLHILFVYHVIYQRLRQSTWGLLWGIGVATILVGIASHILAPYGIFLSLVYMAVVSSAGLAGGGRYAITAAVFVSVVEIATHILRREPALDLVYLVALEIIPIFLNAVLVSLLTGSLGEKIRQINSQNRDLNLLLHASLSATGNGDLSQEMDNVAGILLNEMPCYSVQILLLMPQDNQMQELVVQPRHLRATAGNTGSLSLSQFPEIIKLVELECPTLLGGESIRSLTGDGEQLLSEEIRSAWLVPLVADEHLLGLLLLGYLQESIPVEQVDRHSALLYTLGNHLATVIHNRRLHLVEQKQSRRLALLNEVARAISTTIALDDLLELIYEQLMRVIPSDTYYVAIVDENRNELDIHILYDEGRRYEPVSLPIGPGLGSAVIRSQKPLFIRHYSREASQMGLDAVQLGADRRSESWIGVPLMSGEKCLGLVAIAAYKPYSYEDEDLVLLKGVAAQAALSIQNARSYAALEEQARRDSLTRALNHGAFLKRLDEEVSTAQQNGRPLALIMLDIDYFKDYNDIYGHLVGDQVLMELVRSIQANIKKGDAVGRWGGEEFAILLPGATGEQALHVANRIRATLAAMSIRSPEGTRIPPPTASQGMASFPEHVANASDLVELADKALYEAKHGGRDRVRVAARQETGVQPPGW